MAANLLFPLPHDRETQELHHRRLKAESSSPFDSQVHLSFHLIDPPIFVTFVNYLYIVFQMGMWNPHV